MTANVRRCARCGAEVLPLMDVALAAAKARRALDTMKLALPSELTVGVRQVADALAHYASLCPPSIPRDAP